MAIGLYKPGHGYWVRVLTATMLGVITLATAAWAATQMVLVANSLPRTAWQVTLNNVTGTPEVGSRVNLLGASERAEDRAVLGTAEVASYDPTNEYLILRRPEMTNPTADPSLAKFVASPGAEGDAGGGFVGAVVNTPRGTTAIEPLYLQGGAAALVILVGAALTYLFVGLKPRTVDFLIATDMEMKKVNWSTRKDIQGSTGVVIGASILIALFLFVFDMLFRLFFSWIGVVAS